MGAEVPENLQLDVIGREQVTSEVVVLVLARSDGAELPSWTAGAHVDVVLPAGLTRQYSLCGRPEDKNRWQIAVLRATESRGGSSHLHDVVEVGDSLRVVGPRNHFALEPAAEYLFIAGGIGITPIIPMMRAAAASAARWSLAYGGRTRDSMAFAHDLVRDFPDQVTLYAQDESGFIPLERVLASAAADTQVYCCGPEPLLAACESLMKARPLGSLHVERFSPRDLPSDLDDGEFEVELASSGSVLTVRADQSVLSVLLDAGVDVDWSCGEGTCGTCETIVLSGIPEHRDSVLSDSERAENTTMFVCVSRAVTPRLLLDL